VGQICSQHDKCQVGNMHTYSLDLVHFPIIPSSFSYSLSCPLYVSFTITVPELVPYPYQYLVRLGARLKKRIVRLVGD
jgi:hypothetical protein